MLDVKRGGQSGEIVSAAVAAFRTVQIGARMHGRTF